MPEAVPILLLVEHVARELDIACLFRHLAAEAGVELAVASIHFDLHAVLARYQPRVVVTPCFASAADANLRALLAAWPEAIYVNLAYEQVLSRGNQAAKRPADRIARRHVLHLASGAAYRDFLLSHGVPARHIAMVGSLPLGLYRRPYRERFADCRQALARQYGLDAGRPWIFFPENYSAAFLSDRDIERRIARGFDRRDAHAYRTVARRSLEAVARWCDRAARQAAVEWIVRPRPATDTGQLAEAYRRANGHRPPANVHFIKGETVREWNGASDLVVTSYSTTAIEAALCGKPVYVLLPEPLPPFMDVDWLAHVPAVTTADALAGVVRSAARQPPARGLAAWASRHLLAETDPLGAASRLCI